jgi:hypothetical protein
LFDGYKRHVLRDQDTGLIPAVRITTANVPEAAVTGDIAADLAVAEQTLAELHIDRAYLTSDLVRDRGPPGWRGRGEILGVGLPGHRQALDGEFECA